MNSKNLVLVQHGTHRGLWVRSEADRDRAYEAMSTWSKPLQAIAATYPVRVAETAEGWGYVRERALGDGLADAAFEGLGREMAKPVDPDELPSFIVIDDDDDPRSAFPHPPSGNMPTFRTETVDSPDGGGGIWEICADGKRVSLGAW